MLLCQRRRHLAPERGKVLLLPCRLRVDRAQLLARREAGDGLRVPRLQQRPVKQTADAHHIKFIEIRAVDRQKLQPLIARQRLVGRLGQHAAVKGEPAQLAVQKQAGIGRVGRPVGKQAAAVALCGHLAQRLRARQLCVMFAGHTVASLGGQLHAYHIIIPERAMLGNPHAADRKRCESAPGVCPRPSRA